MSDAWQAIAEAIAAKLAASAGCAAAGLRGADARVGDPLAAIPFARVMEPSMAMVDQTADVEEYDLSYPVEVVVPRPTGRTRSRVSWSAIARAIQVEWRSGQTLGGLVAFSLVASVEHGLVEHDDEARDGCVVLLRARAYETVSPARTA